MATLRRAGCTRELFPQDSLAMLHEATRGAMRDIDRVEAVLLAAEVAADLDVAAPGLRATLDEGSRHAAVPSLRAVGTLDARREVLQADATPVKP